MGERATAASIGPGTILNDTYRVERPLGRGGMGTVWEASHLRLPKRVAVKVLHAVPGPDQVARFRQEAEIASRLGHPNIVDVLDFHTADGMPYMVMELLQGESLATRLERGPLDPESALAIVRQIAAALQAAHDAGVIHRDLKPANVFLVPRDDADEVKVLDFGISKVRGSSVVLTDRDAVMGTPQYMAPEQASGRRDDIDARTDQFALAAIAYEMLAGRPAFHGEVPAQVMFQIVHESPPPLDSNVPAAIARALTRALATRPGDRYPDLSAFVEALTGSPLKPASDRMNQATAAASPVHAASDAATRPESRTVREPPRAATRPESQTVREPPPVRRASRGRIVAALVAVSVAAIVIVWIARATNDRGEVVAASHSVPPRVPPSDAANVVTASVDARAIDAPAGDSPPGHGSAAPASPSHRSPPPALPAAPAVPADIAARLDLADKELDAGDLDAADQDARATTRQHEVPRANAVLAAVGCARHDLAQAHGFMRRAGTAAWPAIRRRCAKLGFPVTDPD
jgi:serine/threonine protein kinase